MGVVDGTESAEKSAESIVYLGFKYYVYCKSIQLIISFISISFNICDEYQNSQLFNISRGCSKSTIRQS